MEYIAIPYYVKLGCYKKPEVCFLISKIKNYLSLLGYPIYDYSKKIDYFTKKSLDAFQKDYNFLVNVEFSNELLKKLEEIIAEKNLQETFVTEYTIGDANQILEPGERGEPVKDLQKNLYDLGYYRGKIDGIYGPNTETAVRNFQKNNNLPVTGTVDQNTLFAILSANQPTLSLGSNMDEVRELELILQTLGYFKGNPNAVFDKETQDAVKKFQTDSGITADGIVGRNTWRKLEEAFNPGPFLPTGELPNLIFTSSGAYVELLQNLLKELGYLEGQTFGYFGPKTSKAVENYRRSKGLPVSTVVDQSVWNAINNDLTDPQLRRPVLRINDSGDYVTILQKLLKRLGYFPGSVTGSFDKETENGVKSFQRDNGLNADGIVGPQTWNKLYEQATNPIIKPIPDGPKPTIRRGDEGPFVSELQQELKDLLYYDGQVDGIFGNMTEVAVKSFQDTNALVADGVVGVSTWNALYALYPPPIIC